MESLGVLRVVRWGVVESSNVLRTKRRAVVGEDRDDPAKGNPRCKAVNKRG